MRFELKLSAARCGLAEARGTKGAWNGVSVPLIALPELVVDGVSRCTKHVPAWRQVGTGRGSLLAADHPHPGFFSFFFFYLDLNCAKGLREIVTYIPLRDQSGI